MVVHCTRGKDRTGLVSALILRIAGVSIDAIAADYGLSRRRRCRGRRRYPGGGDDRRGPCTGIPPVRAALRIGPGARRPRGETRLGRRISRGRRPRPLDDRRPPRSARGTSIVRDSRTRAPCRIDFTCTLADVGAESLSLVGGKGANLGELVRAGLPVPRAFVVTTHAYRHLLEANGLKARILAELDGIDYEDAADIERRASAARDLIVEAPVPADLESAIRADYLRARSEISARICWCRSGPRRPRRTCRACRLRDSRTPTSTSPMPIRLIDHVRRCWASLWTDRAISYRQRQGFAHEDVALAVVVQEMFPAGSRGSCSPRIRSRRTRVSCS